jgi:hypothetical protein
MRFLKVLCAALVLSSPAFAQTGTVTNHAFALGKGPGITGYTSLLCTSAQLAVGQAAADPVCQTITGDVTITAGGVTAIGSSKVVNSQLSTMAANTTKCNGTGATANPTDCTAATMRTNLGLVIGTNVEAWDADLDCFAALATTGVLKRTGAGTCSAGVIALADIATGTQDTNLGYWGTTALSAIAMPNCSNSLTYSTSTHTFGCNTSAGTGTVTSVTCFGTAITSSGTCATAATKTDEQTATSTSAVVTPSQQQQHPSAIKAMAYVTQSGGTYTLSGASYNVASVTKSSTGVVAINLTTAFASTAFGAVCMSNQNGGSAASVNEALASRTASGVVINIFSGTATPTDFGFTCMFMGSQ